MKKFIIGVAIVIFCLCLGLIVFLSSYKSKFYLDSIYYEDSIMSEITYDELEKKINDRGSFVLFIYQPACSTSAAFEDILTNYQQEKGITILKIAFAKIKDTEIGEYIKYYPSFIIFRKGKMIDYLDAESNVDKIIYETYQGFTDWLEGYIHLKDYVERKNVNNEDEFKEQESPMINPVSLENVTRENGKVNVYFFWGDGCPHCAQEFKLWENLSEKYSEYFNLYTFEVWYNEDNAKNLPVFGKAMGDNVRGIPYTVIGSQSFEGFDDQTAKGIEEAILSEKNGNFDVYFDKIK